MKKRVIVFFSFVFITMQTFGQCNFGLNLGTVVVPTHGNSTNGGNFGNVSAWQQASAYIDTLNLDYRQRYITWTDVVSQITANVPTYTLNTGFENILASSSGSPNVHVVYPIIKVGVPNTLETFPPGASTFTSFLDTSYISQNYKAVRHILSNISNVKWISLGNEIETYFGGAYLNTGRLTKYAQFLNIMKSKINTDFPNVKVGTIMAFHTLNFNSELNLIDSVLNSVDYIGYTFYYTTNSSANCWDSPTTVKNWLNLAKSKSGSKKLMLTETCMGDGGGVGQNCGSPSVQLAYADTLLRWYNNNASSVEGMTWFTVTDPYLGWQTPNTLWNTCGLVDSNGVTIQPAGTLWRHQCSVGISETVADEFAFQLFPNPSKGSFEIKFHDKIKNRPISYKIVSIIGSELYNGTFQTDNLSINLTDIPEGIYYLIISHNSRLITRKLIIQK